MLASLIIVGVIVSLIVQALKKYFGTDTPVTLTIVAILSIIAGTGYYFLSGTAYWEGIVEILISAGAVYAFILKRFETS